MFDSKATSEIKPRKWLVVELKHIYIRNMHVDFTVFVPNFVTAASLIIYNLAPIISDVKFGCLRNAVAVVPRCFKR